MVSPAIRPAAPGLFSKPGPWVDLALTLPLFLVYQLGVVFLNLRNGTDLLTAPLMDLAEGNRGVYLLLTSSIGVVFAAIFALLGRGQAFRGSKFVQIAVEGVLYAVAMRIAASYVVGNIFAGKPSAGSGGFGDVVQSCGAGFYEELAFRVVLFGVGAKLLVAWLGHQRVSVVTGAAPRLSLRSIVIALAWCLVAAALFSGAHYVGSVHDEFKLTTFTFRLVLGVILTLIYVTRGFAAAVWTHAVYDVWVFLF